MKPAAVALLVLGLSLTGLSVQAQTEADAGATAESAELTQAREHFVRGAELYKEGSYDAALAEFTRAQELVPNYRVLYNIAQVQVERHDYAAALRLFNDYLRQGSSDLTRERREQVEAEISSLQNRVGELTVTANVPGAELSIDGVAVGTLPLESPVMVSSGVRRLALKKPGYLTAERSISVAGGDKPEVAMTLETAKGAGSSGLPARQSSTAHAPGRSHTGLWLGLTATTVLTGTAVVFGVLTHQADSELDSELDRFPAEPDGIDDSRSRLSRYAALTDGFAAGAGVAALVTLYFALSGPSTQPEPRATGLQTTLVPTSNGISFEGRFESPAEPLLRPGLLLPAASGAPDLGRSGRRHSPR